MLKLPYAIRDYHALITEDYVYFDRTDRISIVENLGKELLFLRPRRPTPLHNQYLVMKWDFSAVESYGTIQEIRQSLYDIINEEIAIFADNYQAFLNSTVRINPDNALACTGIVSFGCCCNAANALQTLSFY